MDSKEMNALVGGVRAGGPVPLPVKTRDWYAEIQLLAPEAVEPSGAVIQPRPVRVELRVAVRGSAGGPVLAQHIRPGSLLGLPGEPLAWSYGAGKCYPTAGTWSSRSGFQAARMVTRCFAAATLSSAVAAAVAAWEAEDEAAYTHITARDAAVAAEEAAYAVRLAS